MENIIYWHFFAGLGLFLFGMWQLEEALKGLAGRSFKLYLRYQTGNPVKAIFSGIIATAALQSSSVVGLIVLAFVGSGVIKFSHALGIILGSNLGTTFTGWIVTLLGFKLKIEEFALPLIAIGTLGWLFVTTYSQWRRFFQSILELRRNETLTRPGRNAK